MTNSYLERAHHLFQTDRMAEAEAEIHKALAENPNEAMAYALLAECYIYKNEFQTAVETAKKAVTNQPDEPVFYYILGKSSFYNKDIPGARLALAEGQRLDPSNAQFFLLRSQIEYYQQNWEQALHEANRGLELDPEHVNLVNQRAQSLIKLNRKDEAASTMDYALYRAPENSYSHANKGWVAIEKGQYDQAIANCLEALRLDPSNDLAREGLKEAIKGKNPIYRVILKYFLWMNKMQDRFQWGFIIGIYLLYRGAVELAERNEVLAPFLYPFIVLYILFAFSTWIALPISNLFLRLHPIGRHALVDDEKLGSNLTGLAALISLLGIIVYFLIGSELALRVGIVSGILMVPIGGAFTIPAHYSARKGLTVYAIVLALLGLVWVIFPDAMIAIGLFAIGIFAYGWVVNYLISKSNKEFH